MKLANMRRLYLLMPLVLFPVCLRAQAEPVQAQLIALENRWNSAELKHDSATLGQIMADDLVLTEPDGSVIGKTEELAFAADPDAHFEVLESHDLKAHIHGDTAIVTGAYHEKGSYRGKAFEHRGQFTDTWVRHQGTWQCIAGHFSVPAPD